MRHPAAFITRHKGLSLTRGSTMMGTKNKAIPVNTMDDHSGIGIAIEKIYIANIGSLSNTEENFEEATRAHREDRHSFFLLESGTVYIEIDFERHEIIAPSLIYMHPDQVHRILDFDNVGVTNWAIDNENLNREYVKLLEGIRPAKALPLNKEMFSIFTEATQLCIKFAGRKTDKLYHSLLRDSCNALIALVISQYLEQPQSSDKLSRFDNVTKGFKELLEQHYINLKRPADYALQLNISTPYLNECVKNSTGYSVSYHIQQRIILEAKRLLYHSNKSIKEIATTLGYDDYPYFSRLFTKATGMSAMAFRNTNMT